MQARSPILHQPRNLMLTDNQVYRVDLMILLQSLAMILSKKIIFGVQIQHRFHTRSGSTSARQIARKPAPGAGSTMLLA
jgi:hypothetical protein